MKISEAMTKFQKIITEHGDLELIYNDMDTDWAFKINPENLTVYKGVCEIYLEDKYQSETHHYD